MYPLMFGLWRQNELPEDKSAEIVLVRLRDVYKSTEVDYRLGQELLPLVAIKLCMRY